MENVKFRQIPGFPTYGISPGGVIWDTVEEQIIPIHRNGEHVRVWLRGAEGSVGVHRLVYLAYKGKLIKGMHVMHLDENPSNNHFSNLRQDTPRENTQANFRHRGYNTLSVEDVYAIRQQGSLPGPELAEKYSISNTMVHRILHRDIWTDLPVQEGDFKAGIPRGHDTRGHATLTEEDVKRIKRNLGKCNSVLAVEFGVQKSAISKIRTGRTWSHISA